MQVSMGQGLYWVVLIGVMVGAGSGVRIVINTWPVTNSTKAGR